MKIKQLSVESLVTAEACEKQQLNILFVVVGVVMRLRFWKKTKNKKKKKQLKCFKYSVFINKNTVDFTLN